MWLSTPHTHTHTLLRAGVELRSCCCKREMRKERPRPSLSCQWWDDDKQIWMFYSLVPGPHPGCRRHSSWVPREGLGVLFQDA